jgi:hypothetical protein
MQFLDPLAVLNIRFAARHLLDFPGIDQDPVEARRRKHIENRNPINPRGLHRYRGDAKVHKPFLECMQIRGIGPEGAHRLLSRFGRNGHENCLGADVEAGGMRINNL